MLDYMNKNTSVEKSSKKRGNTGTWSTCRALHGRVEAAAI